MASWEGRPSQWTIGENAPGKPYVFKQFPMMLYKAKRRDNGKWAVVGEPKPDTLGFRTDNDWARYNAAEERFSQECQTIVETPEQLGEMKNRGWRETPKEALEYAKASEDADGIEAALRNARDKNMSPAALAESARAEEEHFGHLPSIPESPTVKKVDGRTKAGKALKAASGSN